MNATETRISDPLRSLLVMLQWGRRVNATETAPTACHLPRTPARFNGAVA